MRRRVFAALTVFFALTALAASVSADSQPTPAYRIIASPEVAVDVVDRSFLEDAFLKKRRTWPNDEVIHPVDLEPHSAVRERFSAEILQRSVDEVRAYWQQRIFSGRDVPPPELDTDEQVVAYVLGHEGAIGYVSASAELNGAKVLGVR